MAEVLEANNVSWRTIQQPDNFDDDGNAWFKSFHDAKPGDPLYEKGVIKSQTLLQSSTMSSLRAPSLRLRGLSALNH